VCDIVRPIAAEKGLTVGVTLPTTDLRLGHALALRRVLLNLTTNALKFTERGSVDIVATEKSPTRMTFTVRDTGPGINPEALASLFHPFRRSAKAGRYLFSGTGLGLALTRRLVRAMGSELCLETRPNVGTQFWFDLELPPAEPS
jgi:signal transduction histidine kinase